MTGRTPISTRPDTLCPYATLFRSEGDPAGGRERPLRPEARLADGGSGPAPVHPRPRRGVGRRVGARRHPPQEPHQVGRDRSEEHTSELQSLMRISYAVFCLKKKNDENHETSETTYNETHTIV